MVTANKPSKQHMSVKIEEILNDPMCLNYRSYMWTRLAKCKMGQFQMRHNYLTLGFPNKEKVHPREQEWRKQSCPLQMDRPPRISSQLSVMNGTQPFYHSSVLLGEHFPPNNAWLMFGSSSPNPIRMIGDTSVLTHTHNKMLHVTYSLFIFKVSPNPKNS